MLQLLSLDNVFFALGALVVGIVWAYRAISKQSAELKAKRLSQIGYAAHLAYQAVNEYDRKFPNATLDKVTLGLKKVDESLSAAGAGPATEVEAGHVQQIFDALHFAEKSPTAAVGVPVSPR